MNSSSRAIRLGLRANWQQFTILVLVTACVGGTFGVERSVVPVLSHTRFAVTSNTFTIAFIISFAVLKAVANLFAGRLSDRFGRKPVLIAGWLIGLPVPFLFMTAPSWGWVVFGNALLGIQYGLCWSSSVIMKIDLAGPARRGLSTGLNEGPGYVATAIAALISGHLADQHRLALPFYFSAGSALVGLVLSLFVNETRSHARHEWEHGESDGDDDNSQSVFKILKRSWTDRRLFAATQAGMVDNLADSLAWGILPMVFAAAGLTPGQIGLLAAIYPAVWGLSQMLTGRLSDDFGRKHLIVVGLLLEATGFLLVRSTSGRLEWAVAMVVIGIGTGLVYPSVLATVSELAPSAHRATAIGAYRLWRDGTQAAGALLSGVLADLFGFSAAIVVIAAITILSAFGVARLLTAVRQPLCT